jgi:hypothetical protein
MIIKALYRGSGFLEANIIESCKGGTIDVLDRVIGNQKMFLPPHEHKVRSLQCLVIERVGIECFGILAERLELAL